MSLYAAQKLFQPIATKNSFIYRTLFNQNMRCWSCKRGTLNITSRFNNPIVAIEGIFSPSKHTNKLRENFCLTKSQKFIYSSHRNYFPDSPRKSNAVYVRNWTWFAKPVDIGKGGPVRQAGGGIGKLDAANEAGHFHRKNTSSLEEVRKRLKAKALQEAEGNPLKPIVK